MEDRVKRIREEASSAAAKGRAYNARIRAATGQERAELRRGKAAVGREARVLLLSLAAIRGAEYRALERRCREDLSGRSRDELAASVANRSGLTASEVLAWMRKPAVARPGLAASPRPGLAARAMGWIRVWLEAVSP